MLLRASCTVGLFTPPPFGLLLRMSRVAPRYAGKRANPEARQNSGNQDSLISFNKHHAIITLVGYGVHVRVMGRGGIGSHKSGEIPPN